MRIAILAALWALAPLADAQAAREAEVKSAFVFNFLLYVDWPKSAFPDDGAPYVVAVLGGDGFGGQLERTLEGKTAQGRPVKVRKVAEAAEAAGAHVVLLPKQETDRRPELIGAFAGRPVLLVTESEGLARKGAACNFVVEEQRVRLEVNVGATEKAGLRMSAKLLKIARRVDE
jgi:hypothetical protein